MGVLKFVGSSTLTISDDTNYGFPRDWTPRIAARSSSVLGGRSRFENVEETIPIVVYGSTAAAVLSNLHSLSLFLNEARLWYLGASTQATVMEFTPDGSSNTLQAPVYGTPDGRDLIYPDPTFNTYLRKFQVIVNVPLLRGGPWLDDTGESEASSGTAQPGKMSTATYTTNTKIPSPFKAVFSGFPATDIANGYVLFSNDAEKMDLFPAEDMTVDSGSGTPTVVASAEGGDVMRVDDSAASTTLSEALVIGTRDYKYKVFAFASVKNNSSSIGWLIRFGIEDLGGGINWTPYFEIDTANFTNPTIIPLGQAATLDVAFMNTVYIEVTPETTGSGSETLDIDYAVTLFDDDSAHVVKIVDARLNHIATDGRLTIDAAPLSYPYPIVYTDDNGSSLTRAAATYQGDAYLEVTGGSVSQALAAILLLTNGSSWTYSVTATLTATHYPAYLVPQ